MEQNLNGGTLPSNKAQKKKNKKKKAAVSAMFASPTHATPPPSHAGKRSQTDSPSIRDDLARHRKRASTEARGTKETQGNGAGAGFAKSATSHRISPRDAGADTAGQVSMPKLLSQKKLRQTQPTKVVSKPRPSDVFFAQSSAQRKELLKRLKAEQQRHTSDAHDGQHIDDSDDDATDGDEEAAENDGEEAAEEDGKVAAGDNGEEAGEEAAAADEEEAAEDDGEKAAEEAAEDDAAEEDEAEAQGASIAAGSQQSSMQASPASAKRAKLHGEPRIADKLKKHKKRKKHRKHKEHKTHSQRSEHSPSRSQMAEETDAPILAASQEHEASEGKRVSYTAVAGGSADYNDAQEERETAADDSNNDDDTDLQMLQTQLLETQIPYETQPY
jgi:hypothetical protein